MLLQSPWVSLACQAELWTYSDPLLATAYTTSTMPAHIKETFRGKTPLLGWDIKLLEKVGIQKRVFRTSRLELDQRCYDCLAQIMRSERNPLGKFQYLPQNLPTVRVEWYRSGEQASMYLDQIPELMLEETKEELLEAFRGGRARIVYI